MGMGRWQGEKDLDDCNGSICNKGDGERYRRGSCLIFMEIIISKNRIQIIA